jgi:capsid protein
VWSKIKRFFGRVRETTELSHSEIYGTPIVDRPVYGPIYGAELYKENLQTVRTIQELNRLRHISRYLYERNGNAFGAIDGIGRYVINSGSKQTVASTDPDRDPPKRLSFAVTEHLKAFKKANQWKTVEREIYRRYLVDGEVFILLTPNEDGITSLTFIEPDQIVPPEGESHTERWSWGILKSGGIPIRYNVRDYTTNTERQIPAVFVFHLKRGSNLNQKRGLPALTPCIEDLLGGNKLRYAAREGQKVRSAIAYVRQHAQAPVGSIQALQNSVTSATVQRGDGQTVVFQRVEPGSVQDIPEGLEYKPPPTSADTEAVAVNVKLSLEAVAATLQCPYWLISGDSTASSYASSLTAESPFIKLVESDQDVMSEYVDDVLTAVIEIATEQEVESLPFDTLEKVDLQVTYTVPVVRQKLEETQRNEILRNARIKSRATIAAEEGLDFEKELANFAAEDEQIPATPVDPKAQPETASGQMQKELDL